MSRTIEAAEKEAVAHLRLARRAAKGLAKECRENEALRRELAEAKAEVQRLAQLPAHPLRQPSAAMLASERALQKKVAKIGDEKGEFVTDVDGFVYWWPDGACGGHYAPHHLRALASELDERNKDWQAVVDNP